MTPQLCTFAQSVALKHLGFNWKCQNSYYDHPEVKEDNLVCMDHNSVYGKASRPTIADAIRWFRIEKGLHGWVESTFYLEDFSFVALIEQAYKARERIYLIDDKIIYDYDSCESALLNRLIELTTVKVMSNEKVKCFCMNCGTEYMGEPPKMCCNGRECGCMGMPIDPVVCSSECYYELMNRAKKPNIELTPLTAPPSVTGDEG